MTVVKSISLKELSDELDAYGKESIEEIKKATVRGAYRSLPDLVRASPIDTGLYASSWDVIVTDLAVSIGNFAPHAPIIEFGTRPFRPPLKPLLDWAKRVLNDPGQPEEGYSSAVWGLAVYTQRKIEKDGMEPRHIMTDMIPKIIENIKKEYKAIG